MLLRLLSFTISSDKEMEAKELKKDLRTLSLESSEIDIADGEASIRIDKTLDGDKVNTVNDYFEDKYDAKVNIGVVSNIVQRELIKNAIFSVILALIGIIIYVSFRFKFSYAFSGVICLVHDVLVIFALFGIFHIEIKKIETESGTQYYSVPKEI